MLSIICARTPPDCFDLFSACLCFFRCFDFGTVFLLNIFISPAGDYLIYLNVDHTFVALAVSFTAIAFWRVPGSHVARFTELIIAATNFASISNEVPQAVFYYL